jgi:hypothetical protein
MGYFWDQLERKWIPRPRWEKRPSEWRRVDRRKQLLRDLILEIEDSPVLPPDHFEGDDAEYFDMTQKNDRAAKLYATLLARSLIGTDEWLMKAYGEQIAKLTGERREDRKVI